MIRKVGFVLAVALSVMVVVGIGTTMAGEYGTAAEAKAMLEKAVAALKADAAKALGMFTKGEGGFKDRDLYPFCGGPDGNFTAHPKLEGQGRQGARRGDVQRRQGGKDQRGRLYVAAARQRDSGAEGELRH